MSDQINIRMGEEPFKPHYKYAGKGHYQLLGQSRTVWTAHGSDTGRVGPAIPYTEIYTQDGIRIQMKHETIRIMEDYRRSLQAGPAKPAPSAALSGPLDIHCRG